MKIRKLKRRTNQRLRIEFLVRRYVYAITDEQIIRWLGKTYGSDIADLVRGRIESRASESFAVSEQLFGSIANG